MNRSRVFACLLVLLATYGVMADPVLELIELQGLPAVGYTEAINPANASQIVPSDEVLFGGFSGLTLIGPEAGKQGYLFRASTDRGPTTDPVTFLPNTQEAARPFVLRSYRPRIIGLLIDFVSKSASLIDEIALSQGDGKNLTGLPNLQFQTQNLSYTDEFGVDLFGNIQPNDPMGADPQGIVVAKDDSYWLVDRYRPSIYHFDSQGKALARFIPQGAPTEKNNFGTPILPAVYAQRRNGRGFGGAAVQGDFLYIFMESPLDNPNTVENTVSKTSANIRILVFDTVKEIVFAEYLYELSEGSKLEGDARVDRIGDVTSLGNGRFLVVEQDSRAGSDAYKAIFEVDVTQATDISDPKVIGFLPPDTTFEQLVFDKSIPIYPVTKKFIVNLAAIGFAYQKVDGLAVFNSTSVVVVNNNDYQVVGSSFSADGRAYFDRTRSTYFGLVTGLNFTSSVVTTTFNPTTGSTTTGATTGGVTTTQNATTTTTTTGSTTTGSTTTTTTTGSTTTASTSTSTTTGSTTTGSTTTGTTTSTTHGTTSTTHGTTSTTHGTTSTTHHATTTTTTTTHQATSSTTDSASTVVFSFASFAACMVAVLML